MNKNLEIMKEENKELKNKLESTIMNYIKKYVFLFFLVIVSHNITAQVDFDTLTLKYDHFDMSGSNIWTFKIYDANLNINGYDCHEISRYYSSTEILYHHGYIAYEGDSILWYDEVDETFKLQYDFSASVGDTIHIPSTQYTFLADPFDFKLLVTEVDYLFNESMTDSLKMLTIKEVEWNGIPNTTEWSMTYYGPQHIQYFGSSNFFTPYTDIEEFGASLRCMDIDGESFYKLTDGECDISSSVLNVSTLSELSIYPNPINNNIIYIELKGKVQKENTSFQVDLISSLGKVYGSYPIQSSENQALTLPDISKGIYWLVFKNETGKILGREKFVKK